MNHTFRRDEHTGYLGNSRLVLNNHYDASTQADIHHVALSYESEDELSARWKAARKPQLKTPHPPHYSRQDILEQYCISERGRGALEANHGRRGSTGLFGCLSTHQPSPCSVSGSLLTACVLRQKAPSDENLYDLYKRHPVNDYAPYPKRNRYPWAPLTPEIYKYDQDLKSSYFRRKAPSDPSRYSWMPSDDESIRMEKPKSILEPHHTSQNISANTPPSKKHVSFARSHTLTSFDDAIVSINSPGPHLSKTRSQERLLDGRKEIPPITRQPEVSESMMLLEKLKRSAPMKTQATQTEAALGRKPLPPGSKIRLSPRTVHRVKMVSQGAQTNGIILNGRKLTKSFSEAGNKFSTLPSSRRDYQPMIDESIYDHEPLHRTQSDEPPRSPFLLTSPTEKKFEDFPIVHLSDTSSISQSEDSESKKEIFIDFKPQVPPTENISNTKRALVKTVSDGQILLDQRKLAEDPITNMFNNLKQNQKNMVSMSHECLLNDSFEDDDAKIRRYEAYFQKSPTTHIRNEGVCKPLLSENVFSSFDEPNSMIYHQQDSIDEEFHEHLIYNRSFMSGDNIVRLGHSPMDEGIVPSVCVSPFASNDSLNNDIRDHSDGGIWNESQATVLTIDSGTENGTGSDLPSIISPNSVALLTPKSRRKCLLMLQHQQRSSMDTEALDEELEIQNHLEPPKLTIDKPKSSRSNKDLRRSSVPSSGQFLSPRPRSPMRRRRTEATSPLPAVVPDVLLARTDSGKTITDISESTTTDDYFTANSGTDSSRKSGSNKGMELYANLPTTVYEGSSFESNNFGDDMVVPSFSPIHGDERVQVRSLSNTPVPEITGHHHHRGRATPQSDTSSSCGSYSVGGSCADLLDRISSVPSPSHYPPDDETTWRSPSHEVPKRRRPYILEIKDNGDSQFLQTKDRFKPNSKRDSKISPSRDKEHQNKTTIDKPKRIRIRTRSPNTQNHKRSSYKKVSNSGAERLKKEDSKITSDESSCDFGKHGIQISPRKTKKNRENNRRKSLPKVSPTDTLKISKRSSEEKSLSLPGSLNRTRKSVPKSKNGSPDEAQVIQNVNGITSPHSATLPLPKKPSPTATICQQVVSPTSKEDTTKLKALSAESLRSVSPGSDSVFYSDPSSHGIDHQVHCLHCGKEVDIVTTESGDPAVDTPDLVQTLEHHEALSPEEEIVQPPEGFGDSPKIRYSGGTSVNPGGRLYKKMERRIRSEERSYADHKRHRHRPDVRAKSEERGAKIYRSKLRPMAPSTNTSQEGLKATDSSPSVLPGEPENEDDQGVYDLPYRDACWLYIDEREEVRSSKSSPTDPSRKTSVSSTESEQEFRKRYQAVTHRMVHRKSCLEMYKRQTSRSFESDKTVIVQRESGEFGFRIHGSKPVVVSAIENGTPAETSGLEVGDIVLAVNGVSVLDKSHSEVVKIAHAGSDTLKLEVARTCYAVNSIQDSSPALFSGYLWKLSGYASGTNSNKWIRRWFCLKQNNCLYYYKTDTEKQPVGAIMLYDHEIQIIPDDPNDLTSKPHRFAILKSDNVPLHLAADNVKAQSRWVDVISQAISDSQIVDEFLEANKRNLTVAPSSIPNPDCFGYLVKLGTQWKAWNRRYCVLKDACLYFYQDANAKNAFGLAYLHGYKVQQSASANKKHAFEIIPADPEQKHYYFHTESDTDRKRWIAALEYSIDRWLKL